MQRRKKSIDGNFPPEQSLNDNISLFYLWRLLSAKQLNQLPTYSFGVSNLIDNLTNVRKLNNANEKT